MVPVKLKSLTPCANPPVARRYNACLSRSSFDDNLYSNSDFKIELAFGNEKSNSGSGCSKRPAKFISRFTGIL